MTKDEIIQTIKDILVEKLKVDESLVTPDAYFTSDLGADSLDQVEIVMECETTFKIVIPDDKAEKMETVGDLYRFVNGLVAQ